MARRKKEENDTPKISHNLSEVKAEIAKRARAIVACKKQRAETNAEIAEHRAAIVNLGVPKKAFDAALYYYELDEDQRQGLDLGYAIAREALGLPFKQGDLWDGDDNFGPSAEENEAAA